MMVLAGVAGAALLSGGCDPPDVKVKESPIEIVSETIGHGREARAGDVVCIDYCVLLPDGEEVLRDDEFSVTLGAGGHYQIKHMIRLRRSTGGASATATGQSRLIPRSPSTSSSSRSSREGRQRSARALIGEVSAIIG